MFKATISSSIPKNKKITWLASLRGLAVFLVFFSHLDLLHMPYTTGFMIGRIGVVIFFLISGYLALGAKENRTNYQYILNRFFRIYPIYWLMLVLRVVVAKFEGFTMGVFLLNLTAFSEFFRVRNIIGSSWMLPIMVIFFFVIGLSNNKWGGKIRFYNKEIDIALTIMIILGIAAIITGYARYTTKLPLPTAIFLLILVGFLGVFYKCYERKIINKKMLEYCFWLFEISLLISAWLSYGSMSFAYFISYNIGIVIFLFFKKNEIQNIAFDKLGVVGMTFFLGAKTPMLFLNYDFDTTFSMRIVGCLVEFVLAFGLAFIVTKYIENPLLKYTKK